MSSADPLLQAAIEEAKTGLREGGLPIGSVLVRDGKIIAIGTDRDILRLADVATRRIDLHGRTATPGLIDSHAHIADAGVEQLYHVHLSDASTVAEVVRRVQAGIARLKPGE